MNNRWCIIASPRTGSNYLEEMIYLNLCQQDMHVMRLGEILHRTIWAYADSDSAVFRLEALYNSKLRTDFRIDLFEKLKNNPENGAVMRLFVQTHHLPDMDYKEFVDSLVKLGFKFINLTRDIFDSSISLSMAQNAIVWHRKVYENNRVEIDGDKAYANNPSAMDISLSILGANYMDITYNKFFNNKILSNIDHAIVRYESILEDCKINNIPIEEKTNIKKLYDKNYSELVTNYSELKHFYQSMLTYEQKI